MTTQLSKRCNKCGETKPIEAFSVRSAALDGRQISCKRCMAAYGKAPAQRERDRQQYETLMATNPERRREQQRRWNSENPDKVKRYAAKQNARSEIKAAKATWAAEDRKRNPSRLKLNSDRYRQRNAEKIRQRRLLRKQRELAYNREYRETRREELRAKNRAYRERNLARERARSKAYSKRRPEVGQKNVLSYRARKRGAFVEHIDPTVVYRRDKAVCGICRKHVTKDQASIDHIIPLARGGEHAYRNVQLAHLRCNIGKGAKLVEQRP